MAVPPVALVSRLRFTLVGSMGGGPKNAVEPSIVEVGSSYAGESLPLAKTTPATVPLSPPPLAYLLYAMLTVSTPMANREDAHRASDGWIGLFRAAIPSDEQGSRGLRRSFDPPESPRT